MADTESDIDELRTVVEKLRQEVETLSARVDDLEEQSDDSSPKLVHGFSGKEARVLRELDIEVEPGERVTRSQIDDLYRRVTNLRRKGTIRYHVQDLTDQGPFDLVSPGVWTYTGGDKE